MECSISKVASYFGMVIGVPSAVQDGQVSEGKIEINVYTILSLISGVLLTIGVLIRGRLPPPKDIEEKCIFHAVLNQILFYFGCSFISVFLPVFEETYLAGCSIFWYLFVFVVLSSSMWLTVLLYHFRRRFKQNSSFNESKHMSQNLMVGYGIPALIMGCCKIHNWLSSCNELFLMASLYGLFPLLIIWLVSLGFVSKIRIVLKNADPNSPIGKLKSWYDCNTRLLHIWSFPWILITCHGIPNAADYIDYPGSTSSTKYTNRTIGFFVCSEGIFTFFIWMSIRRNQPSFEALPMESLQPSEITTRINTN